MGYLFLTGATGLLGSYLIRDLVRSGTPLALLVRSTRLASAQHRIESLVGHWEHQTGYALPRPVVLEGDLTRPDLGLNAVTRSWVARNCQAVMHNAASLTFHGEGSGTEPWRSNLDGTRNLLEFSRQAGLREFHHVSTAYVCGLREDLARESELDVGQAHGNDYEVSKFQAEQLVRAADFIDQLTVYRPGIIFGDSQTGYTSTFHGFYVPLKLVSTIISKVAATGMTGETLRASIQASSGRLREVLSLTGRESKNFVPVDWVSAVMADVFTHREKHGTTYHLTPPKKVSLAMVQEVFEQAFLKYTKPVEQPNTEAMDWDEFERFFLDGMSTYRSYWRDDPEFDSTNTQRACPHLPCPEMDAAMIARMCRYAIESNFGWPIKPIAAPEFDLHEHFRNIAEPGRVGPVRGDTARLGGPPSLNGRALYLGLQVNGRGGGQWEVALENGRIATIHQGLSERCTATFYLNSTTFERIARQESTAARAVDAGRVVIEGNGVPVDQLARILQSMATAFPPPDAPHTQET